MPRVLNIRTVTLLALLAAPVPALAQEQLVAFDIVYDAVEYDGTVQGEKFHHLARPAPTEPASWVTPVPYYKGTVYIHQEVMTKPSARNTIITICFDGDKAGYGCIDTKTYTTTGVHETVAPITSTWQYGAIDWAKRRSEYHLVLKDPGLGGTPGGKPVSDFVPSRMRIVMTIVPPGGKYTPPPPLGDSGDGGAAPADAGAPSADAASVPADAAAGTPDAATTTPPPSPDAAPGKPTTKPDAASTPPAPEPDPDTGGSGGGSRPAAKSGGCSMGGGSPAAASLLLLALVAQLRRRRSR